MNKNRFLIVKYPSEVVSESIGDPSNHQNARRLHKTPNNHLSLNAMASYGITEYLIIQIGIRYHLASLVLKVELTLRRRKAKVKVGITPTHFKINFPNGSLVIQVGSNYEKNPNNSDNKDNPS